MEAEELECCALVVMIEKKEVLDCYVMCDGVIIQQNKVLRPLNLNVSLCCNL